MTAPFVMNMCVAEFGRGGHRATVATEQWGDAALLWVDDVCLWCRSQFGKEHRRWQRYDSFSIVVFQDADAMLFKLTWL